MTIKLDIGVNDQVYFYDKNYGRKFHQIVECAVKQYTSPPFEIRNDWKNYFVIRACTAIFRNSQPRGQVHKKSGSSIS